MTKKTGHWHGLQPNNKKFQNTDVFTIITFILLFATWLIFSGKFDLFHLSLGVISSFIVAWISSDLLFQEKKKTIGRRLVEAFRFVNYMLWLLIQIFLANLHVIGLAISPRKYDRDLDPHIFTFNTILKTDFARFVLANSITLTPGTVTIRIEEDTFYVHAISRKVAGEFIEEESVSEMEKRVAWVFEGGQK